MSRLVVLGFVYGAATPIVLTVAAATVFAGGSLFPLAALTAVVLSAPIAVGITLTFGVPLYFAYRRLGITSLSAYLVTGLMLSLPVAAFGLWDEYYGGYLNARQALLQHAIEFICLISGPTGAAVFWSTVRPDLADAHESDLSSVLATPNDNRRRLIGPVALGTVLLACVAVSAHGTMNAPQARPKLPLKTEYFPLDSTKAAYLIASLNEYASSRSAHLGYYFMPTRMPNTPTGAPAMPPVLIMANLRFLDNIQITVTWQQRAVRYHLLWDQPR
jgi:hypothetical protein